MPFLSTFGLFSFFQGKLNENRQLTREKIKEVGPFRRRLVMPLAGRGKKPLSAVCTPMGTFVTCVSKMRESVSEIHFLLSLPLYSLSL